MNMGTGNEEVNTLEYCGEAQQTLYNLYGDPREKGWSRKWLLSWKIQDDFDWFPSDSLYVHKAFRPRLYNAFRQIEILGLFKEIKTLNEDFNIRYIYGSDNILSVHSWGMAIDMNAETNPLGSAGTWSEPFIEVMTQNGIFCGQNWIGRADPMHFSMING